MTGASWTPNHQQRAMPDQTRSNSAGEKREYFQEYDFTGASQWFQSLA